MAALFALVLAARAADPAGPFEVPTADVLSYPIGAGDVVHIDVVGEAEMTGDYRVGSDGAVELPYGGRVVVAGLTVDEARKAVTLQLSQKVFARPPQVVLDVASYASRKIDVSGIVAKPDTYALDKGRTTVSDVLVRAGGLTDGTAAKAVIYRDVAGERQTIEVDLERLNAGDMSADKEVLAGDHVYVPPVESVFVDGQVQKPGAIAYRDGMTVTQAITQAGSTLGTARKVAAYIMRGSERIPVNLKRILSGEEADIVLRPSDRVYIPESVF